MNREGGFPRRETHLGIINTVKDSIKYICIKISVICAHKMVDNRTFALKFKLATRDIRQEKGQYVCTCILVYSAYIVFSLVTMTM